MPFTIRLCRQLFPLKRLWKHHSLLFIYIGDFLYNQRTVQRRRNAKMNSRRRTFSSWCWRYPKKKDTRTRLSSLTRKTRFKFFNNHFLLFSKIGKLCGWWNEHRVSCANVFCFRLMALFIVCAIDVIDWFDFYKFEVSQDWTSGAEYQTRLIHSPSLSTFWKKALLDVSRGFEKGSWQSWWCADDRNLLFAILSWFIFTDRLVLETSSFTNAHPTGSESLSFRLLILSWKLIKLWLFINSAVWGSTQLQISLFIKEELTANFNLL